MAGCRAESHHVFFDFSARSTAFSMNCQALWSPAAAASLTAWINSGFMYVNMALRPSRLASRFALFLATLTTPAYILRSISGRY
jgi:hypothetical protein